MIPDRRPEAGFTLVEILLAVLIAGLVMVGSYSVASQVMGLAEDAKARLELESTATALRLALANDLGSIIYVERTRGTVPASMAFSGGIADTDLSGQADQVILTLASAATLDPGLPFPAHAFNRLEYVLRPETTGTGDAGNARLVRRERVAATVPRRVTVDPNWNETVLAGRLENVQLHFLETAQTGPVTSWDSQAREQAKRSPLPGQVHLEATLVVGDRRFPLDIRINLPARTIAAPRGL